MRPEVFLPLALLFLAHGVPSKAQKVEVEVEGERRVSVRAGAPLTVECSVRVEQRVEWQLDGGEVPADLVPAGEAPAPAGAAPGASRPRLVARLHAAAARPHHAGLYTCSRDSHSQRVRVLVTAAATGETSTAAAAGEWAATAAGVFAGAEEAVPVPEAAAGGALELEDGHPYDVGRMFSLNCTTAGLGNTKTTYVWKKNGTAVELLADLADRYSVEEPGVFRMTKRTHEDDFGNYTCDPSGGPSRTFYVRGRPYAKLPSDTNVVEDTKLKIVCKVVGKPHPRVEWTFSNDSKVGAGNGTPVAEVLGARVKLSASEQGVEDAQLEVEAAARADAGVYTCRPLGERINVTLASTTLRVKDKYAALWPFLGICAEVFVLCAIILVYEKRRTKPELDDSDTDNHDQKKS